jgi:hypothetical protein
MAALGTKNQSRLQALVTKPAPKGAIDNSGLAARLKACPDTNLQIL